jgi:hypothetical protein
VLGNVDVEYQSGIRRKSETNRSFTSILTVVRLHIMSYGELISFLKDTYKAWRSSHSPPWINKMGVALSFDLTKMVGVLFLKS